MDKTSIEREALTEDQWLELAEKHACADWDCAKPDGFLHAVKALCADFALLAQQPEAVGWVSVKDRLPPAAQTVLVYGRPYGTKQTAHMRTYAAFISTRPREVVEDEQITHWMPLPRSPE
jgi:hypothetical protein